jgi:hypothetical protein
MSKRIGATALCRWKDTKETAELYFSFGEYDQATDTDGFGVYDGDVFFYCSEGELEKMIGNSGEDFEVIKVLYYNEREEVNV